MKKLQYLYFYFTVFFQFMVNITLLIGICWSLYEATNSGSVLFALLFSVCFTIMIFIHSSDIYMCYIFDAPKPHMTKYGIYYYILEHNDDKDEYVLSIYQNMFFFFGKVVDISFHSDEIDNVNISDEIERIAYTNKTKSEERDKQKRIDKEENKKKKEQVKKKLNRIKNIEKKDDFEEQISKL